MATKSEHIARLRKIKISEISRRDLAMIGLPALVIVIAAFWGAYQFVKPAPPDSFVMSTGREDGAYHAVGLRYKELLAKNGISVQLKTSAGAVENLSRLADENSDVEVGLVQAGTGASDEYPGLVTLGSVYYEPIWIFYRGPKLEDELRRLRGKRIAIGSVGSGTHKIATQLLLVNDAWAPPTQISDLSGEAGAKALRQGSLDVLFIVGPVESATIRSLLHDPEIRLMSFDRTAAFTNVFPYLSVVKVPEGGINIQKNIPPNDVVLLAPTANVVVKEDIHPALVDLLMQAMAEVHGGRGLLHKAGEFPTPRDTEFPASKEAQRFYKSGPPFLQRYMPFWAATLIDRILVLLVPLLVVLLPIARLAPTIYYWRIRSRIHRWYGELKFLELEIKERFDAEELERYVESLENLERRAYTRPLPTAFAGEVYTLRQHIDMVRHLLKSQTAADKKG
ncbi:MAG: TAXI family TRAP transporter solute-binding subunit [Burkholderiales bacterium]